MLGSGYFGIGDEPTKLCLFCTQDKKEVTIEGKTIRKEDVIKEYDIFLKQVAELNAQAKAKGKVIMPGDDRFM
jgi:hypothetical protein